MQTNLFNADDSSYDFKITDDTHYFDSKYGLNQEIRSHLDAIYPEIFEGNKTTITRLERLCAIYPMVPQFKNFLGIAFKAAGWKTKAEEIFKWTIKTHPEFLIARINRSVIYLERGQKNKVPQL